MNESISDIIAHMARSDNRETRMYAVSLSRLIGPITEDIKTILSDEDAALWRGFNRTQSKAGFRTQDEWATYGPENMSNLPATELTFDWLEPKWPLDS